jgi:xanthine dehydrogenase YagR molybdenum-binding subunit
MADIDRYFVDGPLPETAAPDTAADPWTETRVIGKPLPRVDAYERVSGTAVFPFDVTLPDMLHAAILRSPHAHAIVTRVDTSAAEKMPGVRAVITGATPGCDLPWHGTRSKLFDPHCRHEGEEIAAVAAETPYQAWDAVRAIKVSYEIQPFTVDENQAMQQEAAGVFQGSQRAGKPAVYERGDVAKGFAEADVVLEQTSSTACEIHAPMETHGSVVRWDGNKLTIWDSTQGVYAVQSAAARTLNLPLANVRVVGHYMGGGFGSKLGLTKQTVVAALLARRTARPVRLFVTREESFTSQGNRPSAAMTLKAGVKKDGTLTALDMKIVSTGGAYATGSGGVDFQVRDLYSCPNVRTEAHDAYVNAGPQRAFRAPGHPQGNWALEQMIDALAAAIGMDPVELRLKNVPLVSQARNNQPYTSTGLKACLLDGAEAFGWKEAWRDPRTRKTSGAVRRGVGVAAGMWQGGGGSPPSTVIVKLFADGSANVNMGASDNGCGTKTWMAMIVAEELGLPLNRIQVEHADTATTQFATPSGGSKTVPTEAPACRAAALEVRRQIVELAAEQLKVLPGDLVVQDGAVVSAKEPATKVALTQITGVQRRGVIVGVGTRGPNPDGKAINPWAAHFAEVQVDTRTGEVRLLRYLAAQDSGRVMNRLTYDNQVFGGVAMGIGLALTEQRVLDRARTGRMVNANFHDYMIPTAMDVPADQNVVAIDPRDTACNTTGAKGIGEPATVPAASAIANAIYNAIGVRITTSPIDPAAILKAVNRPATKRS